MNIRFLFIIFFIVAGLYKGYEYIGERKMNKRLQLAQAGALNKSEFGVPGSCKDKKYCVTVFVAPWCPACKTSHSTFFVLAEYLLKNRSDVGFGVVIGAGSAAENNAEKEVLSKLDVQIDDTGVVFKNRRVSGYPTWVVNDYSGKEILRKAGGLRVNAEQMPQLLAQFLEL